MTAEKDNVHDRCLGLECSAAELPLSTQSGLCCVLDKRVVDANSEHKSMKFSAALAISLFVTVSAPAFACLPPPPGMVEPPPPTKEERAETIYNWSSDIVYGIVTSGINDDQTRFRVLHVYKGALKKGEVIEPLLGMGFDGVGCAMVGPPPAFPGQFGVIGFNGRPELNFIGDHHLNIMFEAKWIVSAKQR